MPNPTPPATPERSLQQRRDAIQQANRVRFYRAELKRSIRVGDASAVAVLTAPVDPLVATMKVADLLRAIPKVGRVKVDAILKACLCSPSKTIGGLSPRQRRALIARVIRYEPDARAQPDNTYRFNRHDTERTRAA